MRDITGTFSVCWKEGWFRILCERQREGGREAGDSEMAGTMVSGARMKRRS